MSLSSTFALLFSYFSSLVSPYPACVLDPALHIKGPTFSHSERRVPGHNGHAFGHVLHNESGQPSPCDHAPPVRLHPSSENPDSHVVPPPIPASLAANLSASPANPSSVPTDDFVPTVHIRLASYFANSVSFADLPLYCLNKDGLIVALSSHAVPRPRDKRTVADLLELALLHRCNDTCLPRRFTLSHDYSNTSMKDVTAGEAHLSLTKLLEKCVAQKFPRKIDASKRQAIIEQWIDTISNSSMEQVVCALCAERLLRSPTKFLTPSDAQQASISSDHLPPMVRPLFHPIFGNALLEPAGFSPTPDDPQQLIVCCSCLVQLNDGRMPRLGLANNNFLGWNNVPDDIRDLFNKATAVEKSLIARYRVKCTIHKFSSKRGGSPNLAQSYMQGNTITFANNCNGLLDVLPPAKDLVGDTICVMFVGSVFPSPKELKKFTPILARRHVVLTLLTWLKANNPYYKDVHISMDNLNDLLPGVEPSVPNGISTCLVSSALRKTESATYVPHDPTSDDSVPANNDIPFAPTGVIGQSIEGLSIRDIKLLAIQHWKSGGGAYTVPHGPNPINEYDNPSLFPCMFPHLFPFGLGGLEDSSRPVRLSIDSHVKHLLNLADTRFQTDNSFAFVAMNILQRRKNSRASRFKISKRNLARASELLSSVEASTCATIIQRGKQGGFVSPLND